jgi:nicotinate-nucleotide adenylyltransferase
MTGLFFGSFDPIHIGHVNIITSALNSGIVDDVAVIPAFKSVWKDTETSFLVRCAMCTQAIKSIPHTYVSTIEQSLAEGKPLPTYKTLEWYEGNYDFYIITTPETYLEIPRWQKGDEILEKYKFLIVTSSHFDFMLGSEKLEELEESIISSGKNKLIYSPSINVCSTSIRQRVKNGNIVIPFVQDDVLNIIKRGNLYK